MPVVRPARRADRPALVRLQSLLPDRAPELLAHGLRTGGVLVSTAGDRPVGYLLAVGATFESPDDAGPPEARGRSRPPETTPPSEASDACATGGAHLAELAVAPARRREGRASALLTRLVAATDGPVSVAVAPGNDAALALYRHHGFERTERREGYFASGPALWLVRR